MKIRTRNFILIAAMAGVSWLMVAPGTAYGQGETRAGASLAQMIESARWRLGVFRINAALELSNAGYDSDLYSGYLAEPVADYTFSASTPVQVLVPVSKKVVIDLSDRPQYVFYLDTPRERAWNNTFRGQVHIARKNIYIQAGGGMSNVRRRLSYELDINVRQKQDSLGGLVLWQVSKRASLAFVYGSAKYDLGQAEFGGVSLSDNFNRKEDYFDFITYIEASSKVRFFVDGQYGSYAFTKVEFRFKDARSYGVFGGIEFTPKTGEQIATVGIEGKLRLGYQRFDVISSSFMDGSGITGTADIAVSVKKRNRAHAFFFRGFQFSAFSGSSFYLATAYGGGISRLLSRKTSLFYDISFGRNSYPGSGAPEGFLNNLTTHSFGLNIRLARQLSLGFLGTLGKRILDMSGRARNRNFFGFNFVYGSAGGMVSAPGGGLR